MKRFILLVLLAMGICRIAFNQTAMTQNVILVTFDGLRWQEVFTGADKKLVRDSRFVSDTSDVREQFWADDPEDRRSKLMPFFWSVIAKRGQVYGNRYYNNKVNTSNMFWFSYPGYNEILTGIRNDHAIYTNRKVANPNITILEYLNSQPDFYNKVAVFGSWDLFPYILNRERSKIFINAGYEPVQHQHLTEQEELLNRLQSQLPSPWPTVRLDAFTHHFALEYMKQFEPRVLEISYGETDDIAHDGKYDGYLYAINRTDRFIEDLWNYVQSSPFYRNRTTIIITTDHGRGHLFSSSWKKHGRFTPGSGQTWFAVIGPDTEPEGEIKTAGQFYQNQFAETIATLLGKTFSTNKEIGLAITQVVHRKDQEKLRVAGLIDERR